MWFAFGLVTLLAFSVYSAYTRIWARWKGTWRDASGKAAYEYLIGKYKQRSTSLHIGIPAPEGYHFALKRERGWDVLFKWLGVSEEFQCNEPDFDQAVYVVSDDKRFHQLLKSEQVVRGAVLRLVESRNALCSFSELRCRAGRIWVRLKPASNFSDQDVDRIAREVVPRLRTIAAALESSPFTRVSPWRDPFVYKAAGILAISTGLAFNGVAQWWRMLWLDGPVTLDRTALFMDALRWGAAEVFALMVATVFLLGRSSRTHLVLLELLIIGTFGAVATTAAELRDANIELDDSQATCYVAKTYDKWVSHHRKSPDEFYVRVSDWHRPTGVSTINLQVTRAFYDSVLAGERIRVSEKPGYFHYRWIEKVEKVGKPDN